MKINEITQNTNYRDALAVLRTGNNWSLAEFVSENKLPLQGAITSYTDEETGKITRYLLLGTKRFQISSTIPNEELVDDKGAINTGSYKFHVVELINRYATTDPANPVVCHQIHRTPIGEVMMEVYLTGLDDTLEQE